MGMEAAELSSFRELLRERGCLYPCPFLPTVEGRMERTGTGLGAGPALAFICAAFTL